MEGREDGGKVKVSELHRMCVYLSGEERVLLERMAESEQRSMSWMLRRIIREGAECRDIR